MTRFGLIGKSLSHSFSKKYFEEKFADLGLEEHSYELLECADVRAVESILGSGDFLGLNVTIPYKRAVMAMLDSMSEEAKAIGAVNCIANENGQLVGYNTDAPAFEHTLVSTKHKSRKALVLGSGGASKAVDYVLSSLDIQSNQVSRTEGTGYSYESITPDILAAHDLIVNCTPVGMAPGTDEVLPLPVEGFHHGQLVYDLIYNPRRTSLMNLAASRGARVMNGLSMLHLQAELGWEIWSS